MTWGEFKMEIESRGVKDGMTLSYIDMSGSDSRLVVEVDSRYNDFFVESEA